MSTFDGYFTRCFGRRIRADRFTQQDPTTVIQLLSHVHADHTVGLSSRDLRGVVYCSAATRDILLRSATASERVHADINGVKSEDYYTFRNLQEPVFNSRGRPVVKNGKKVRLDVLKPLELDTRHDFSAVYGTPLAVTLIDANHCPGAVMFLIESPQYAVLYTGDVRAEPFLINSLVRNPCLQTYVSKFGQHPERTLDEIYLDTSAVMTNARILSKREGVEEAMKLFDLFPPNTRFFLNCWTWGYEELLRSVAHRYNCKIHLDDYKQRIFAKSSVSEHDHTNSSIPREYPTLSQLGTSTFQATRFHACERRWKCAHVRGDGVGCYESPEAQAIWEKENAKALQSEQALEEKGLLPHTVFVNPAEATHCGWKRYAEQVRRKCELARNGQEEWPTNLLVPLARHSTLPELQDLVGLFRPKTIYPNTIYPEALGADYMSLPSFFGHVLTPGGKERLAKEAQAHLHGLKQNLPSNVRGEMKFLARQDAEDEMEDGVREETIGKFATLSGRVGGGFLRDNFDHLEDEKDIDLLMAAEPEVEKPPPILQDMRPPARSVQEETAVFTASTSRSVEVEAPVYKPSMNPPPSPQASSIAPVPSSPVVSSAANPPPGSVAPREPHDKQDVDNTYFLPGCAFYFGNGDVDADAWSGRIEEAGGIVVRGGANRASQETALGAAHFVVCSRRKGWEYEMAVKLDKHIGNSDWLQNLLDLQLLADPRQNLLWFPYLAEQVEAFKTMSISSTGFSDSQKQDLRTLTELLGARYLPDMVKNDTSVLITCDFTSRKCAYARKWKIPVANFLWLEDCYIQQRLLPMTGAEYVSSDIPERRVGERSITKPQEPVEIQALPKSAMLDNGIFRKPAALPPTPQAAPASPPPPPARRQLSASLSPGMYRQPAPKRVKMARSPEKALSESFQSTSTTHQDDTQQIRNVNAAFRRGAGLPRLKSVEEL